MKINNKKITIVSLALAMGAALAGSVSGSVAWYQYSTRAAASVSGTSAGTSRNLQVSLDQSAWKQYLNSTEIKAAAVKGSDGDLIPVSALVTSGAVTGFKGQPVYQYVNLPAIEKGYLDYTIYFKCEDTTKAGKAQVAKNVFLTTFNVTVDEALLPAIRVAINDGTSKFLLSKTAGETATKGELDLNNNNVKDTDEFDQLDAGSTKLEYTSGQESYTTTSWDDLKTSFGDNPYTEPSGATPITTTKESGNAAVNFKIWIEGWQELNSKNCWEIANTINKAVQIDMRFEVKADQQ